MRIEASVTSISWIPSEAVEGLPRLPFTFGVAHYDDPPPDRVDHLETMHRADLFREANELRGWIEFDACSRVAHQQVTPCGTVVSPAVVTAVASAPERDLSLEIMRGGDKRTPDRLRAGDVLVEEGDAGEESSVVYLVLDGVLEVVVDGEVVGEVGPGAIVGERAGLEDGMRTASLRAKT